MGVVLPGPPHQFPFPVFSGLFKPTYLKSDVNYVNANSNQFVAVEVPEKEPEITKNGDATTSLPVTAEGKLQSYVSYIALVS